MLAPDLELTQADGLPLQLQLQLGLRRHRIAPCALGRQRVRQRHLQRSHRSLCERWKAMTCSFYPCERIDSCTAEAQPFRQRLPTVILQMHLHPPGVCNEAERVPEGRKA